METKRLLKWQVTTAAEKLCPLLKGLRLGVDMSLSLVSCLYLPTYLPECLIAAVGREISHYT